MFSIAIAATACVGMRHFCNVVLRVLYSFEIMLLGRERGVTAFSVDYDCVFLCGSGHTTLILNILSSYAPCTGHVPKVLVIMYGQEPQVKADSLNQAILKSMLIKHGLLMVNWPVTFYDINEESYMRTKFNIVQKHECYILSII